MRVETDASKSTMSPMSTRSSSDIMSNCEMEDIEDPGDEAELTSLSWLQSLDITSATNLPTPPCSPPPPPPPRRQPKKPSPIVKAQADYAENAEIYRTDVHAKPPYSYATLICLAMQANDNKLTLSSIYTWVKENFLFFTTVPPAWKNSIRHNLSLNRCFVKVPRTKGQPGKGGFWKLDLSRIADGRRTKRRNKSSRHRPQKTTKESGLCSSLMSSMDSSNKIQDETSAAIATILNDTGTGPKVKVLYETPPNSISPIPDSLPEIPESTQVSLSEDELTGLLIDSVGWDENHLDILDSLLDTL